MMDAVQTQAYRASLLYFTADPRYAPDEATHFIDDGLLVVQHGKVLNALNYADVTAKELALMTVRDYRGQLIMPGFIDTHVHFPQIEMIASYGEQLLEWLNTYTFPTEQKYADADYAHHMARVFIRELLRHGTTSAMVFATVHPQSVDALFSAAADKAMRLITGKVMMDRHAPEALCDDAQQSYQDSRALIQKWHHHERLLYAVTPRFAPTSTPEQLRLAGELLREFPDVYMQTHLSENKHEIDWVKSLFPEHRHYLDVYHHHGLTGSRSLFAHALHLEKDEVDTLSRSRSSVAFCPSSNLFLGSGLFPLHALKAAGIRVGMGTDVGAGTSLSLLQTLNEGYKVQQLLGEKLSAREGLYQATLGSAEALSLDDKLGNFLPGKEADFVVLDWAITPLQQLRQAQASTLDEKLFALMMQGDDRNVAKTYVNGACVHTREEST
ncbi:guanine deaminase [Lonsdalea britannica]|uniref:guanine deaminase n=1 Tax=Lonsdalea britannica TaxID=1082704 RepID=UPI000A1D7EF0|nr:guanine deaminase [Lonsdalea britannica]OSN06532.1 guanine deaminase [Lonsdalea britannica]